MLPVHGTMGHNSREWVYISKGHGQMGHNTGHCLYILAVHGPMGPKTREWVYILQSIANGTQANRVPVCFVSPWADGTWHRRVGVQFDSSYRVPVQPWLTTALPIVAMVLLVAVAVVIHWHAVRCCGAVSCLGGTSHPSTIVCCSLLWWR
jgi:hypothetical protein